MLNFGTFTAFPPERESFYASVLLRDELLWKLSWCAGKFRNVLEILSILPSSCLNWFETEKLKKKYMLCN